MFIDTHCHIFKEYYDDINTIIDNCQKNDISKIIVSGCDMKSNMEVLELVNKYDMVYGSIGFHPTELDNFSMEQLVWLEENINNKKIVAIGEIGLDYHYNNTDKEKQMVILKRQLDLAKKYNKPIIFHSRDAINDTYNILSEYKLKGSIHCYSGSLEMAKRFIQAGYMLGIGGVSTYKNAKNIKEVIKEIPLSYFLLETDSPYLAPEPKRGSVNEPSNIPLIASVIADLKGISIAEVARACTDNTEGLFDFSSK